MPAVYAHDFQKVKTSGTIAVNGRVKGEYGDSAFPALALNAKVNNAAFQYPDLPLPARDIAMDLAVSNPGGSADNTVVRLQKFHALIGRNPLDATLTLKTPISDPDLDARVVGKVDLADVRRTVKLDGVDQLAGTVAADAAVRTRMSYVDKKQYDRVNASGTVDVAGLTVKGASLPHPLAIQQASLRFAPERAELRSFQGSIGSSDFAAAGTIDNLLAFAMRDDTLRGVATVRSNKFNLDEWQSGEGDLQVIPVPPKINFDFDATVNELTYDKLTMKNARGRLRVKDQRITLEDFRMNTLGGEIGRDRILRDHQPGQADVRRRAQDDQGGHPLGLPGLHDRADARPRGQVRGRKRDHRPARERRPGEEHDAALPQPERGRHAADLADDPEGFPGTGEGGRGDQAPVPGQSDPQGAARGLSDQGRPAVRAAVRREAGRDDDERLRLQRARPVAAVHAGAPRAALADGRRRQPGDRRPDLEGGRGRRRSQRRARDRARPAGGRDGHESRPSRPTSAASRRR